MRLSFLTAIAAAVLISTAASAADMAVKAPSFLASSACTVATATTPLSCSGFYVGGGLSGAGSNADIIGSGINGSVFAGGVTPTLDAGYQYVHGNWVFGAEFDIGYSVNTNAVANGVGNSFNGFRLEQDFKVGGNLAGMLGVQSPITIPASLANAVLAPYVHTGITEWQLPGSFAAGNISGAGVLFGIGPRLFGDLRYTYTNFNGAKAGGVIINNDQALKVLIDYKLN